ncbi:MAG: hypothetical protein R3F43_03530 [bacterium]
MERLDLRRQSIYLRGPCGEMPAEIAGGIDVSQDARLAHVTVRANRIDPAVISHTAGTLTLHDVRDRERHGGPGGHGRRSDRRRQRRPAGERRRRPRLLGHGGPCPAGAAAPARGQRQPRPRAADATLGVSDVYATGGLTLDSVEGTIADALIYPGTLAALRLSGASAGLEFSRITVRTPPDAVQPQPAVLNDGVAFHLEGLDVEGRGRSTWTVATPAWSRSPSPAPPWSSRSPVGATR